VTPRYIAGRLRPYVRMIVLDARQGNQAALRIIRAYEACRTAPRPAPYELRVQVIGALKLWLMKRGL
jgi:hypothetical protein